MLYQNYLNKFEGHGVIRLEPPDLVSLPLKVYTYIQATGQIMVREVSMDEQTASKAKAKGKAGHNKAKAEESVKAKPKAKVEESAPTDDDDDDDQEGDEEEDNDEEDGYDQVAKELKLLDSMQGKKGGKKPKKKSQPKNSKGKTDQDKDPAATEPPSKKVKVGK